MLNVCPYCEVGTLEELTYSDRRKVGRRSFDVTGLLKLVCTDCESESVPLEMYEKNAAILERVASVSRAAVSRGMLRRLRELCGITQREASRMFGAGASAFAKWESGQSELSTPSALLVQCAAKVPGVLAYLAELAQVEVKPAQPPGAVWPGNSEWHSVYLASERTAPYDSGVRLYLIDSGSPSCTPRTAKIPSRTFEWSDGHHFSSANGTYLPMLEAA